MKFNCIHSFSPSYNSFNNISSGHCYQSDDTLLNIAEVTEAISVSVFLTKNSKTFTGILDEVISVDSPIQWHESTEMTSSSFRHILSENMSSIMLWINEDLHEIYVSRDPFGKIPIYYTYIPNEFLAIATDINFLLELPEIRHRTTINEQKIHDYLSINDINHEYTSTTFYSYIHSVLPSNFSRFTSLEAESEVYVSYKPERWSHLKTLEEFSEVFGEKFINSINRAISSSRIVGSHLSGGLDSSSVISTARYIAPTLELHSFFFNVNDPWSREDNYALDVSNHIKSHHHIVSPHNNNFDYLLRSTSWFGQPQFLLTAANTNELLMESAKFANCDTLLTGHDGDSIVGYGRNYLTKLYESEQWDQLQLAISNQARHIDARHGTNNWQHLSLSHKTYLLKKNFLFQKLFYAARTFSVYDCFRILGIAKRFFLIPSTSLITKLMSEFLKKIQYLLTMPSDIRASELTSYIELQNKTLDVFCNTHNDNSTQSSFLSGILYNQNVRISEELFTLGKNLQINVQHPYFDFGLYELSLAVPDEFKFNNGIERGHLRESMKGILPESVRTRTNKSLYNDLSRLSAISLYHQSQDLLSSHNSIWNYVNSKHFKKCVKLLQTENQLSNIHHVASFYVNRTIFLATWLHQMK